MSHDDYDLAIIGAGAGGLEAANFAVQLGARVALIEKSRIGGDCTWTGCVPSKSLLKAAKIAHDVRRAEQFGIGTSAPVVDMKRVRDYVRQTIQAIYPSHTPQALREKGIDVILGPGRFVDPRTIAVAERSLRAKKILVATGARPKVPAIDGIEDVPFATYEDIFDNERLPRTMLVIGGGPIGIEIAQAYQRLGAQVTVVAERLLPKDEPEVRNVMEAVLQRDGMKIVRGRATIVRRDGDQIVVATEAGEDRGELLLVAAGRAPAVDDLGLEKAGVNYSEQGIPVDDELRTNVKHIYAAGDVAGRHQFSHLAAWQAFLAARNALIPGSSKGLTDLVPWVTFTDPEVAHIGLTEEQARQRFADDVTVERTEMSRADRAICENERDGFIKVIAKKNGKIVGATVVGSRAGEIVTEFILAIEHGMNVSDLARPIHAYPSYSSAVQQLVAKMTVARTLSGFSGDAIRWLSKVTR
ncbi:NAD(P)/FAD-dependent oxidoreductase [Pandoraea sp. E26]|uniref:dihydrolipoyl dehydrogenase family protein n=1 Tax=Pandoraea sp. E26 TaxID=1427365 RepID=UPI00048C3B54|nr:FAD-dependent oxidoreductase [Pandoraea sp. E26]